MFRYLRAAVTLFVVLSLSVIPIWAQEPAPEPAPAQDAARQDATEYAKTYGVELDEALRRLAFQDAIGNLNYQLTTDEEETFAGLWAEHIPDFKVIVRFVGDGQKIIQPYIENSPVADLVEIRTATVSMASLKVAQETAIELVRPVDVQVDSGIDIRSERVKLYVIEREKFDTELQKLDIRLPDNVEVISVDHLAKSETNIYGGLALSECTSGFAVQHYERTLGITTAGHCNDTLSYSGNPLTYKQGYTIGSYDIQWHTAPSLTVRNWIFNGTFNFIVTGKKTRAYQTTGNWICKHGATTGYTCGEIVDLSYTWQGSSTYIRVSSPSGTNLSEAGDSGSPWFNGGIVYGSHVGGIGDDAFYMAANYLDALNVNVYTGKETYLPDVRNKDGWLSTITVRNGGTSGRRVSVIYLDNAGTYIAGSKDDCLLAPNAACSPTPPANFEGSAIIDGSEDLSVAITTRRGDRAYAASGTNPGTVGDPAVEYAATTLYAPALYRNAWNYNSTLFVQNTGSATASGTLYLVGRAGYPSGNCAFSIAPGGRMAQTPGGCVPSLPSPWLGSARIVSTNNQPLTAKPWPTTPQPPMPAARSPPPPVRRYSICPRPTRTNGTPAAVWWCRM